MIPDIYINGASMHTQGWLRESVDFPTPKSQSETVTVPGRNTPIRYTEALGRVSFGPRSFSAVLTMLGTRQKFCSMAAEIINKYAGNVCRVIISEESGLYATGTLEAESSYDPLTGKGQVTFSCEDGDSYRYHTEETVIKQEGNGTIDIQNDFMPVVPEVEVTDQTTLSWTVGEEAVSKTLAAGTWEIPELELQYGKNTIAITTNGNVTFTFREGRL